MSLQEYEISLWAEEVKIGEDQTTFNEFKVCIIGSNTMTSLCRALDPILTKNINGSTSFSFNMPYKYRDEFGVFQDNPYLPMLHNERKVKVRWGNEWYDFIIKDCQENRNSHMISYSCESLFVNELSKTGYSLEFNNELGNSSGTAKELINQTLEGTDWTLDEESDNIYQLVEEPVYTITLSHELTGCINDSARARGETNSTNINIGENETIYVFNSTLNNQDPFFQFLYTSSENPELEGQTNKLINIDCFSTSGITYTLGDDVLVVKQGVNEIFRINSFPNTNLMEYRGNRIVRAINTCFEPIGKRYVDIYKKSGDSDTIYHYKETVTDSSLTTIVNLLPNSSNFVNYEGWKEISVSNTTTAKIEMDFTVDEDQSTIETSPVYLDITKPTGSSSNLQILNTGISSSYNLLPETGYTKGDKFVLRVYFKSNKPSNFSPSISKWTYSDGQAVLINGGVSFSFTGGTKPQGEEYYQWIVTCNGSLSIDTLKDTDIGLVLTANANYSFEKIEFFKYAEDSESGHIIDPNSVAGYAIQVKDYYYKVTSDDKIEWLDPNDVYTPVYNDEDGEGAFSSIRSLEISKSNRFNIIQTICETFQCWCIPKILHDENGKVSEKRILLKQEIGKDTGLSFIYGLDATQITRTIESTQLVTKTIVEPNTNEYGTDGFCTIARSPLNLSRTNFILNFDYYVETGMLTQFQINADLYGKTGYLTTLADFNKSYDQVIQELNQLKNQLTETKSSAKTYSAALSSTDSQLLQAENDLTQLTSFSGNLIQKIKLAKESNIPQIRSYGFTLDNLNNAKNNYNSLVNKASQSINTLETKIEEKEAKAQEYIDNIRVEDEKFYKKYSRFIQEGSWIDDSYMDDDKYYLDAVGVASTSARPQISYNISVARLSDIEEYKNKKFDLGDIAYIEDTDFFGYIKGSFPKTPYKEKILISEITYNFENPSADSITVQNYKTQFEDLFHRITATVNSLQYSEGQYAKAAAVVAPDGTIKAETLANSLAVNNHLLLQSQNKSVVTENNGITLQSMENANHIVYISAEGIFISQDGGANWNNAVTGRGIATGNLTTGVISTNQISIMDGNFNTFRWDSTGINAYDYKTDTEGEITGIDYNKFVRFDHFGIYGLNGGNTSFTPISEDDIWNNSNSKFGLTWKGLFIKDESTNWKTEISSERDVVIDYKISEETETEAAAWASVIRLGRLTDNTNNSEYGLLISKLVNNNLIPVLKADNTGVYLKSNIEITTSDDTQFSVQLGYLSDGRTDEETPDIIHEVMCIKNGEEKTLIIYEDGRVIAEDGYFNGEINASSGTFNGNINAIGGTIGGFNIIGDQLQSVFIDPDSEQPTLTLNGGTGAVVFSSGKIGGMELNGGILQSESKQPNVYIETINEEPTNPPYYIKQNNDYVIAEQVHPFAAETVYYIYNTATGQYIETTDETPQLNTQYYIQREYYTGTNYHSIGTISSFNPDEQYYTYNEETRTYDLVDQSITPVPQEGVEYYQFHDLTEFEPSLTYYILDNESGEFQEVESLTPEPGVEYFIKSIGYIIDVTGFIENDKPYYNLQNGRSNIEINGANGTIYANQLELGERAIVTNQLLIGDGGDNSVTIFAPQINNGTFLHAGSLDMDSSGIIKAGEIILDGTSSTITGSAFSITPDISSFSNVNISGQLVATTFSANTVHAMGGAMIFKPSYKILNITQQQSYDSIGEISNFESGRNYYTFDNLTNQYIQINTTEMSEPQPTIEYFVESDLYNTNIELEVVGLNELIGQYVCFSGNNWNSSEDEAIIGNQSYQILNVLVEEESVSTTIVIKCAQIDYTSLNDFLINHPACLLMGRDDDDADIHDLVIGVNSAEDKLSMLYGQGLTMIPFSKTASYNTPNLFLGNLDSLNSTIPTINVQGYGLYCDNVYLNGMISSVNSDDISTIIAGFNTRSEIITDQFSEPETIILWAGATRSQSNESNDEDNNSMDYIRKAAFFVTKEGSIYASKGYFDQNLFVNATIRSSIIESAIIRGTGTAANEGLYIVDTKNGIVFGNNNLEDEFSPIETFRINNEGFSIPSIDGSLRRNFIEFNKQEQSQSEIIFNGDIGNLLHISTLDIRGYNSPNSAISFNAEEQEQLNISVQSNQINLLSDELQLDKSINIGSNKLLYKQNSENYYNLYIV